MWGSGTKRRETVVGEKKNHKNDKMHVKFSSRRLYSLKNPVKISLKHDLTRVKFNKTPRQIDY